jgi:hypothetical protein
MKDEMKRVIEEDIQKATEILRDNKEDECETFYQSLISKYSPYIKGFGDNLFYISMYDDFSTTMDNIQILRDKLVLFKAGGFMDFSESQKNSSPLITITNENKNENANSVNITISFNEVRKSIENMSALTDFEIEEILLKINNLEEIVNSKDRKSKKWENAKGIINWIADKGVDVGIALLPLLLQIK